MEYFKSKRMHQLIALTVFTFTALVFYYVCSIQPPDSDDLGIFTRIQTNGALHTYLLFTETENSRILGNFIQIYMAAQFHPLHIIRPWLLFCSFLYIGLIWQVLRSFPLPLRPATVLIFAFGMPYMGAVFFWQVALTIYGTGFLLGLMAVKTFEKHFGQSSIAQQMMFFLPLVLLAIWSYEGWIAFFGGFAGGMFVQAVFRLRSNDPLQFNRILLGCAIMTIVALGIFTFVSLGSGRRIGTYGSSQAFTISLAVQRSLYFFKETAVFLKDFLPVGLLLFVLRANNVLPIRQNSREQEFYMRFAMLGVLALMLVMALKNVPYWWRMRFSIVLFLFLFSMKTNLFDWLTHRFPAIQSKKMLLPLLAVSLTWLAFNSYKTVVDPSFDFRGWLDYRERVFACDQSVFKEKLYWGEQHDRYRDYLPINEMNMQLQTYAFFQRTGCPLPKDFDFSAYGEDELRLLKSAN